MNRCEKCGKEFERRPAHRSGRFCSLACYHAVGPGGRGPRVAKTKGQRLLARPHHPIAPPSGVVAQSRLVLYDKIGPGVHPCHWCNAPVAWIAGGGPGTPGNLLADHLDWDIHNDSPANLVPSCNTCNAHRTKNGGRAPIADDELTVMWSGRRTRAVKRYCNACGSEFLTIPAEIKKGRGRYCSRDCMYNRNR